MIWMRKSVVKKERNAKKENQQNQDVHFLRQLKNHLIKKQISDALLAAQYMQSLEQVWVLITHPVLEKEWHLSNGPMPELILQIQVNPGQRLKNVRNVLKRKRNKAIDY